MGVRCRFLLLLCLCMAVSLAQSDRGAITGLVLDPSSAAVPSANVVATNQATGVKYSATTSATGNYTLLQLPVGRYQVAVEASGFRRFIQKEVEVNVAQTVALNVTLEIGQVDQSVEVSAAAAALQTATSDLGTVISRDRVMDLPLSVSGNMRNPESFIFLTPGVSGTSDNTQINGSQSRAKEVMLDGIGATSPESGGILFTYPSVEAISEFKLVSSNFNAEYGRTGGGFEVFTTKSGTNDYHGSLFDYLRNDAFDARGFFARSTAVNRQNEFGASAGGPIRIPGVYNGKNRSFFHFVYSGFRYRQGALNAYNSIPSLDFRQGDFSKLVDRTGKVVPVYDPSTTRADGSGTTRDPFPGNLIPQNRFSSVSSKMIPLLPQPSNSALLNNFLTIGARKFDRDQIDAKIDHSFSDRSRISGFVYIGRQKQIDPEGLPSPLSNALDRDRRSRWVRLNHDYIFSPTMLNNFIFGFTREGEFWRKLSAGQNWPDQIGLRGVMTGDKSSFPRVLFTDGYTGWADEVKSVGSQVNNAFQFMDSVSKTRGNHTFKFGGEARWLQTNGADFFGSQGYFNFNSLETAMPTAAGRGSTGNAFASFLLGAVDNATQNVLMVVPGNRYRYVAAYFQDDWKATRRLTLNWGMRYDLYFPRTEAHNNLSGFDPTIPNPGAGGRPGAIAFLGSGSGRNGQTSFSDTDYRNFGPRFGFAYSVTEKTVLRGGYGIFYAPGNATAGLRASQNFGVGFNASPTYASTNTGITPGLMWDNGFPQDYPKPPFIDPAVANGTAVNYMGRTDGRPPYFQDWNFGIQREFPSRMVLDVAYVGTKGTRLGTGLFDLNQVNPSYLQLGDLLTKQITAPEAAAIPLPWNGYKGSVQQALRPYPQYLGISQRSAPNGNSTYHALQAKIEKRMSNGFTFLTAYTWSKTLSDGDIQAGGGPSGQTFYNRRLEKAISTNDVPHIVNISYLYELPFGPGKKFLNGKGIAGKLAGGWTITGIQQYQSGRPIGVSANNTLPLFNGALRPDAISGVERMNSFDKFDPARDLYINPAAFQAPKPLTFGTAARAYGDLRSFPFYNESLGAIKRTSLGERATLTFRAEFFNVLNRTQLGAPAANISAANFGRVSSQANTPRQGQVALRFEF